MFPTLRLSDYGILLCTLATVSTVASQGIVDDSINFPGASNWGDLTGCIQVCLNCDNWGCYHNSVKTTSGCSTNKCLCSPSHLWNALQFAYSCTLDLCKDYSDAQLANDTVMAYCSSRGYTSVLPPVTAVDTGVSISTLIYTVTTTVGVTTVTQASSGRVSSTIPGCPRIHQETEILL
jgi:hypothetical protein